MADKYCSEQTKIKNVNSNFANWLLKRFFGILYLYEHTIKWKPKQEYLK